MIAKLGTFTISLLQDLGSLKWMLEKTISESVERVSKHRAPFPLEDLLHQANRVPPYTLVGRIRLSSSQAVVTAAEKLMREVVDRYFRPNLTPVQLQDLIRSPQFQQQVDPMVAFSSVCRGELLALARS